MPNRCAVSGCCGTNGLHRFPKEPKLRDKWIKALSSTGVFEVKPHTMVCYKHFVTEDYQGGAKHADLPHFHRKLTRDAVPSAYLDFESAAEKLPFLKATFDDPLMTPRTYTKRKEETVVKSESIDSDESDSMVVGSTTDEALSIPTEELIIKEELDERMINDPPTLSPFINGFGPEIFPVELQRSTEYLMEEPDDSDDVSIVKSEADETDGENRSDQGDEGDRVPEDPLAIPKKETRKTYSKKGSFCIFCKQLRTNISRHFEMAHGNEKKVKDFLNLPKQSTERGERIRCLRNEGNFEYNKENPSEPILVRRRLKYGVPSDRNYFLPCAVCKGYFSKKYLSKHTAQCSSEANTPVRSALRDSRAIVTAIHPAANETLLNKIIPPMRQDQIFDVLRQDKLIILFGNHFTPKHTGHQEYMIRHRLRFLARFLMKVQEECPEITALEELFRPCYFPLTLRAVKNLAKLDSGTNAYECPKSALEVVHHLKTCCKILQSLYNKEDEVKEEQVKEFCKLLRTESNRQVNKPAHRDLVAQNRKSSIQNRKKIPSTQDIVQFKLHLLETAQLKYKRLRDNGFNSEDWKLLAEVSLLYIVVYNRRRSGEGHRITLDDFKKIKLTTITAHDELCDTAKNTTSTSLFKLTIRGSSNRTITAFLPKSIKLFLDYVCKHRLEANVHPSNPYLFGIPGVMSGKRPRTLETCVLMRKHTAMAGLKHPDTVRTALLRKHSATSVSSLNSQDSRQETVMDNEKIDGNISRQQVILKDLMMADTPSGENSDPTPSITSSIGASTSTELEGPTQLSPKPASCNLETDCEEDSASTPTAVPKKKTKKSYSKKGSFCIFCKQLRTNVSRHFEIAHRNEKQVKDFLNLPKQSTERVEMIRCLRNEGNFEYNKENPSEPILVRRRHKYGVPSDRNYFLPCAVCKGYFSKRYLSKHTAQCSTEANTPVRSALRDSRAIVTAIHPAANETLLNKIIPPMRQDQIFDVLRQDKLIILFGNHFTPKHTGHQEYMIRHRLRFLARFLMKVREECPEITTLEELFRPCYFALTLRAIKNLAKLDSGTNAYGCPKSALEVVHHLKICCKILQSLYNKEDEVKEEQVKEFCKLLRTESNRQVNKPAHRDLVAQNRKSSIQNRKKIPSTQDIVQFKLHLLETAQLTYRRLRDNGFNSEDWKVLAEVSLLYIVVYNRRRSGEGHRITLDDFKKIKLTTITAHDELCDTAKNTTSTSLFKLTIRGRSNRTITSFLPKSIKLFLDYVCKHRLEANVHPSNPYMFGIPGVMSGKRPRTLATCVLMRKYTAMAGLKHPDTVRTALLRKHFARRLSSLNFQGQGLITELERTNQLSPKPASSNEMDCDEDSAPTPTEELVHGDHSSPKPKLESCPDGERTYINSRQPNETTAMVHTSAKAGQRVIQDKHGIKNLP